MELITILSTIILVATISTFLLAIGAYILYKVREKRTKEVYVQPPSQVQGELVIPASETREIPEEKIVQPVYVVPQQYVQRERPFREEFIKKEKIYKRPEKDLKDTEPGKKTTSKFYKYTSEGYIPPEEDKKTGALKWR